ncbi:REP-associated tyrosine transposase [Marinigracilibium pacificum]|uniref:Transposase n=1 Tax=Marinigracilibium pacificum TaxID=2729599 RepID=A0A848J4Q1_9BACT|nr:transposase [Marinigracilibium pacificum]NMM49490.1 transposase [Marinigracilibium pacificum]
MSNKYKIRDNSKLYFVTFTVVKWVEIFNEDEFKNIIIESIKFCQKNKNLEVYGWCIMSNHMHMIIGSNGGNLIKIIGEMKSYTSRSIRKLLESTINDCFDRSTTQVFYNAGLKNGNNKDWQLWQQHNMPKEIYNVKMFNQKLNYIHQNPVKAGYVKNEEEYLYSSAADWHGKKGMIELSYIN